MSETQEGKFILCIGSGSLRSAQQAERIAAKHKLPYNLVFTQETVVCCGVYHTSIYDIELFQLLEKITNTKVKITMLDILPHEFKNLEDLGKTMMVINELSKQFNVDRGNKNNIFFEIEENKSFCAMPFLSVHQTQVGGSHCCHMPELWDQSQKFFSSKSELIRNQILSKEKVQECRKCYDLENHGAISDRKSWSYSALSNLKILTKKDLIDNVGIKMHHAVLDNQCNLQCRMCYPYGSNLIAKEYQLLNIQDIVGIQEQNTLPALSDLDTLQQLQVSGGEPSINAKFLDFLTNVSKSKNSDLSILASTNAVIFSQPLKQLINDLPNFKFGVSIDGFDQVNYYIRWPSNWLKILNNIEYLYDQNRLSHFNTTVSVYNIGELYDLYKWIDDHYPNVPIFMNFVETPTQLVPWNFPSKSKALENLHRMKELSIYYSNEYFKSYIKFMESKLNDWTFDLDLLKKFFVFNDLLDSSRKVSLKNYIGSLDVYRSLVTD